MKIGDTVRTSYYLYHKDTGLPLGGRQVEIQASSVLEMNGGAVDPSETITVIQSAGIVGKYIVYYSPLTANHYELFIKDPIHDPSGQGQDWDITINDVDTIDTVVDAIKLKTDTINWDDITFLKNIEGGDWEVINNQMIFYNALHIEVVRFNLFNKDGNPAMERVYKRLIV